jgi:hypothetical protein
MLPAHVNGYSAVTSVATFLTRLYPVNPSALTRRRRSRFATALAGIVLLLGASAAPASAQETQAPMEQVPPAGAEGDRVARLEQQVANLLAMVAALESLVKAQPSATLPQESAAPGGQGFDAGAGVTARVDALETQIGALSSQLELLTQQLGAIEARTGGGTAPQPLAPPPPLQDGQPLEPLPELPDRQGSAPADPAGTLLADTGGVAAFGLPGSPRSAGPGEQQRIAERRKVGS